MESAATVGTGLPDRLMAVDTTVTVVVGIGVLVVVILKLGIWRFAKKPVPGRGTPPG